jgi:ATP-dependent helicase HrpB
MLGLGARSEKNDLLAAMDLTQDNRLRQHTEQLLGMARPPKQTRHDDDGLLLSVLTGFPDRVARRRAESQVLLSTGISAEVLGEPPPYEFMVALDAEDRRENPLPLIRMTARIEPEWLLDLLPDRIEESSSVVWNRIAERVERVSALRYDKLVIEESRGPASEAEAADLLWRKALEVGIEHFADKEALDHFLARLAFAGFEPPDLSQVLRDLCAGLQSFGELRVAATNLIPVLEQRLNARLLNEVAPVTIRLRNGRHTKIHYETGKAPWISSRLQDFFGMQDTPRIGPGKTPLVVHLLAPNHRAVQTTTDLAGFWERLYPRVRRELMRRYPKHAWPERPQV